MKGHQWIPAEAAPVWIKKPRIPAGQERFFRSEELTVRILRGVCMDVMGLVVNAPPDRRRDEIEGPEEYLEAVSDRTGTNDRIVR